MSFLRKIFRGSDPAPAATVPSATDEQPAPLQPGSDDAAGDPAESTDDAHAPEGSAESPESAGAAEAGPAWWEEAAPTEPAQVPPTTRLEPSPVAGTAPLAPDQGWNGDRAATAPPDAIEDEGTRSLTPADTPALAALRSRQGLAAAAQRDIGRVRSVNQDSVFALTTTLPRESSDVTLGLFIVADGMGGHAGGEIASRLAISTVARYVLAELVLPALADNVTEALQPLIIAAVQEANRVIWEHAQATGSDMGTTCTVVLLLGQALYIGHVGDTRAYLVTPGGLRQLTSDHSTVGRLIQVGQLDPAEAREHPLRSQLYRTVGQHPEVLVDFIYQPIGNATHLLLCSDGLWSTLDEAILLDVLEHTIWPHDACRELVARANLAGGEDNIAAIVVTLPMQ